MEIKKYTTYEFEVSYKNKEGSHDISSVIKYKVDESNASNSNISFSLDGQDVSLPASLVQEISRAMAEVDPFGFAYSNLSE